MSTPSNSASKGPSGPGRSAPATPITPQARMNLVDPLRQLLTAITLNDDDLPENKLSYSIDFLNLARARLNPEVPKLDFGSSSNTAPPETLSHPRRKLAGGSSSFSDAMTAIILKHNPEGREASDSPLPEEFDAMKARKAAAVKARKVIPVKVSLPPQMALTERLVSDRVQRLRGGFDAGLARSEFLFTRNNATATTKFTLLEIRDICRIIFDEIFNTRGFRRARNIVVQYRTSQEIDDAPIASVRLATRLAKNMSLPPQLREFYSCYATTAVPEKKSVATKKMLQFYNQYQLYNAYLRLSHQHPEDLEAFLSKQGLRPSQGKGWASLLLQYLAGQLEVTSTKLRNTLQQNQCMHLMVSTFGIGVLALVPANTSHILTRLGAQKCRQIMNVARDVNLPREFEPICDRARMAIVNPIVSGSQIPTLQLELDDTEPATLFDALGYTGEGGEMNIDMEDPEDHESLPSGEETEAGEEEEGGDIVVDDQLEEEILEGDMAGEDRSEDDRSDEEMLEGDMVEEDGSEDNQLEEDISEGDGSEDSSEGRVGGKGFAPAEFEEKSEEESGEESGEESEEESGEESGEERE